MKSRFYFAAAFLLVLVFGSICFSEDVTPPTFISLSPSNGFVSNDMLQHITGSVDDADATITVFGQPGLVSNVLSADPSAFDYIVALSPGENRFEISAVDTEGNVTATTIAITFNTQSFSAYQELYGVLSDNVWFTPNIASADMVNLFTQPSNWKSANGLDKVFKFYYPQCVPGCTTCGNNTYELLSSSGVFGTAKSFGKIAMETEAVNISDCSGVGDNLNGTLTAITKVNQAGGGIMKYIALDEPLNKGKRECNLNVSQIATRTRNNINGIKAQHSGIVIGDIEPYPGGSQGGGQTVAEIEAFVNAVYNNGTGYRFPFLHIDIDPNANLSTAVSDLTNLANFCVQNFEPDIVLGITVWGGENTSNQTYYNTAMNTIIPKIRSAFNNGPSPNVIFQSWTSNDTTPTNLSECTNYTHANLINKGYGALQNIGDRASFGSQTSVPQLHVGQHYDVVVTMLNTGGSTIWYSGDYYLVPASNLADKWAVDFVDLPPGVTCVGPYGSGTDAAVSFAFTIIAPSTPGSYKFRWRMAHNVNGADIKFGTATPDGVFVNVIP